MGLVSSQALAESFGKCCLFLVAELDTLYTFWDNITHYKRKSVHFLGLMNSATKFVSARELRDLCRSSCPILVVE